MLLVAATLAAALLATLGVKPVDLGGSTLDSALDDWVYNAVFVTAGLACIWRGVAVRRDRAAWIAIGISLGLWGAADIYWTAVVQFQNPQPYPSLADYLYLASYPPYYAGIMLFLRARMRHAPASMWLDGAIAGLAVAALAAAVLTPALVGLTEGSVTTVAVNLAYPLADLILFLIVSAAAFVMAGRGGREWTLITVGLLALGIADSIYLYQVAVGSYAPGTPLDALWLVNASALAVAAWSPAKRIPATQPRVHSLGLVVGSVALAIGIEVYNGFDEISMIAGLLGAAALAGAMLRLMLTLGENSRLIEAVHGEAVTDALTGLGNRRALLVELQQRLDQSDGVPEPFVFVMYDLDGFKSYNDRFGHAAGDALLRRMGRALEQAVEGSGSAYRLGGDEFCTILHGETDEALLERTSDALVETGPSFQIGNSYGSVELPREASDSSTALRLADRRMYGHKRGRRMSVESQTRDVLLTAQFEAEPRIREHLKDVAHSAGQMGRKLGLDGEELEILHRAAQLHDLGKIAIPAAVMDKPGPLDPDEWRLMRKHTLIGERILAAAPAMQPVASVVRSTHERWDGGGYPDGLAGEEIPLASRVIFVCDAFDAMTTDRPYRPAISVEDALAELRRNAGTQFDPGLVEVFCEMLAETEAPALA